MYCNSQGTDGEIDEMYLRHVFPWSDPTPVLEEIAEIGWIIPTKTGYLIPDWEEKGQSTAAQMAEYRQRSRAKQRRYREKNKSLRVPAVTSHVTGDVGEARHKDRHGQASDTYESWPVIEIPGSANNQNEQESETF